MTIKDIAKNCGVSVSTVSRVLNHHPDVSEDVRKKVLAEVERSSYVPNNSARDLVRSHSDAVGVIVRGTGNLFFSAVLKTLSEEIESYGYTMVLHFIDSDADEVKAGAILEREKKLRGLIFLGGRYDYTPAEMATIGIPYVCCSYTNCFGSLQESAFSSVSIDDYVTAREAVEELIRRGHRRIASVVPARDDRSIGELRFKGYRDALREHGLAYDPSLVEEVDGCFDMAESFRGTLRLLERTRDFTAMFMLSDTMAMAAVKALDQSGLRVPEDVSIVAIDGLEVSEYTVPTLATMVQPAEQMAKESAKILAEMLKNPGYYRHKLLKAPLREGASVRTV